MLAPHIGCSPERTRQNPLPRPGLHPATRRFTLRKRPAELAKAGEFFRSGFVFPARRWSALAWPRSGDDDQTTVPPDVGAEFPPPLSTENP